MKKTIAVAVIGLMAGLGFKGSAHADDRAWAWSPLGLGIAAPIQVPFMSSDVYGIRLGGLLGVNNEVWGLDAGLVDVVTEDAVALQASAFSWTGGKFCGLQAGALANVIDGNMYAMQVGAVNAVWGDAFGLQFGAVNFDADFAGLQAGVLNWCNSTSMGIGIGLVNVCQAEFEGATIGAINSSDKFKGLDIGVFNAAYEVTGCQIGLFNMCDRIKGVQIGFVNMITESKLPIMLIANASF